MGICGALRDLASHTLLPTLKDNNNDYSRTEIQTKNINAANRISIPLPISSKNFFQYNRNLHPIEFANEIQKNYLLQYPTLQ